MLTVADVFRFAPESGLPILHVDERRPTLNDRRGKLIALTAAGRRGIVETITGHVANEQRCCRCSPASRKSLQRLAQEADRVVDL